MRLTRNAAAPSIASAAFASSIQTRAGSIAWSLTLEEPKLWELHGGRPIRRPGSWFEDGVAKTEILGQLVDALEGDAEHEVLGFGPLVVTGERTAVEPHMVILPRAVIDWDSFFLSDPVVIVEVPRADGLAEHWVPRLLSYARLPSVRHVVAVHPHVRTALHLRCMGAEVISGRFLWGGVIVFDPLSVSLDLDRVWARLNRRGGGGSSS